MFTGGFPALTFSSSRQDCQNVSVQKCETESSGSQADYDGEHGSTDDDNYSGSTDYIDYSGYNEYDDYSGDGEINLWETKPLEEDDHSTDNSAIVSECKGKEDEPSCQLFRQLYRKDSSTGLWMLAVPKKTCMANDGFVCKVRLLEHNINDLHLTEILKYCSG